MKRPSFALLREMLIRKGAALGSMAFLTIIGTAQPIATIGRSFAGTADFNFDADGACGPAHYAEISNRGLRVVSLATGLPVYDEYLSNFWHLKVGISSDYAGFDPHIEYDHASGRWFAIALSNAHQTNSTVLIGVSDADDPSGAWKGVALDADPQDLRWADYPQLAIDGAAIYIRLSMVGIESSIERARTILTIPKRDLTSSPFTLSRLSRTSYVGFSPTPADLNPSVTPQIDFLGTSSDGLLLGFPSIAVYSEKLGQGFVYKWQVWTKFQRMAGQATGSVRLSEWMKSDSFVFEQLPFDPLKGSYPSDAGFQVGTTNLLGNNYGNNHLRVGDFVYSVATSGVQGRVGVSYTKFRVSSNTIVDAGFIADGIHDYTQPSIASNPCGDVVIAYLRTSDQEFASLYASFGRQNLTGRLVFEPPLLLKAGIDIYDENGPRYGSGTARISDYSTAVSIHPDDHSRFWVSGPYVSARNRASTWISEILTGTNSPPVLSVRRTGAGNADVEIKFVSKLGDTYSLQRSATLSGWQTIQSGISGTGCEMVLMDPGTGTGGRMFWRLELN